MIMLERSYYPFNFKLRLVSNSAAILDAAEAAFGQFGPPPAEQSPDFNFHFTETAAAATALTPPSFTLNGSLATRHLGEAATLTVNTKTGLAEGTFSATVLANPAFFRWHFLELAFFLMLPPRRFLGVHGAALVKDNRAILLRAQSGGGKTTLTYAGARGRYQALAEDVVWIDTRHGAWWGMPWAFHLLPDSKRLFPELNPYTPILQTNGELKLEVNLEAIRTGSTVATASPGSVVLLERLPGGASRLERLPLVEAKSIWLAGAAGNETDFPGYECQIEALLRDQVYRLYFGDDIDAALDYLDSLFEL